MPMQGRPNRQLTIAHVMPWSGVGGVEIATLRMTEATRDRFRHVAFCLPDAVTQAPAWIFRYHTAQRTETWTLRYAAGQALVIVDGAQGAIRYTGTATDGDSLALTVSTSTAKLALDCKRVKKPLSAKCNDIKAKPIDVLDCYHPDFKSPMSFGAAPGIEYVVDATCNGFRLIAP